jgi:hypothetical protein
MTTPNNEEGSSTQAVDWIFTYYATQPTWDRQSLAVPVGAPVSYPRAGMDAPPEIKDPADLRAANAWLQREWDRLKQYTEIQLARIQRESQALLSQNHLNEQSMILGCQELSRKEEMLARQSRALQEQAAELSRRERALAEQFGQWSQIQNELRESSKGGPTSEETAQEQALLASLRAETTALQKSREAIQAELEAMARSLDEQREAREKEQALTRSLQGQMEQRRRALDKAEQAAQRRVAELDELEVRLREEFEQEEQKLAERRKDVAALYARLRQDPGGQNPAQPSAPKPS